MKPSVLVISLVISVLEQLYLVEGSKGLQESPSHSPQPHCSEYCFSILTPILDNAAKLQSASDLIDELKEKVISREGTINALQNKLAVAEVQIKFKDDLLKEKTDKVDTIINMQTQLANSNCQIKIKDLEITIVNTNIKLVQAEYLLKIKDDKVNNLTTTIGNLQSQLKNAEDEISIQILNVLSKEITEKSDELRGKDELITLKEKEIRDKIDELSLCRGTESCPKGQPNGIYKINKPGIAIFEAFCNSTGWMTMQRRQDGSVDFDRNWIDYKNGFGNLTGEFFFGLEKLHQMTKDKPHELYIKLGNSTGHTSYAHYDNFQIGSEQESYKIKTLGTYSGPSSRDGFRDMEGMKFSTIDRDNANFVLGNCAEENYGAWWYNSCGDGLNGIYTTHFDWYSLGVLTFSEMMIKPKSL